MSTSYPVAAIVSLLLGATTFRPARYRYWVRHVERRRLIGFLIGQAITYVVAGLLVVAFADALHAEDTFHDSILTGIVYGGVPHGLARIPLPGAPVQDLRDPQSWLGRILNWLTQWLDDIGGRDVRRWIETVDLSRLVELAWDLYWRTFYPDRAVSLEAKNVQYDKLKEGAELARDGPDVADGLGRLRNFCIAEINRGYLTDV